MGEGCRCKYKCVPIPVLWGTTKTPAGGYSNKVKTPLEVRAGSKLTPTRNKITKEQKQC